MNDRVGPGAGAAQFKFPPVGNEMLEPRQQAVVARETSGDDARIDRDTLHAAALDTMGEFAGEKQIGEFGFCVRLPAIIVAGVVLPPAIVFCLRRCAGSDVNDPRRGGLREAIEQQTRQ